MFQEKFPVFERDMILKADMLTCLKEYPKNIFELQYDDFSDGVVTGANVIIHQNHLTVRPGIIKWNKKLLHMNEEINIPYQATGVPMYLKVRFLEHKGGSDFTKYQSEILLEEEGITEVDELELCRFLLKNGAVLRQDYQDLSDFGTLHNTVNIIYVPYSGYKQPTLSPDITYYFGNEMLNYSLDNPYDISFALLCLQERRVERNIIEKYVMRRLNVRGEKKKNTEVAFLQSINERIKNDIQSDISFNSSVDFKNKVSSIINKDKRNEIGNKSGRNLLSLGLFSNEELHQYLSKILEEVKFGKNGGAYKGDGGRRMIVE